MADRSVVLQSAAYPPRRKTWLEFYFRRSPALVGTGIGFTFKLVQPQVLLVSDDGYFPFPFAVAVFPWRSGRPDAWCLGDRRG